MRALFVRLSRWDRRGDGPHLCLRADVVELRWSDISTKDTETLGFRQSSSDWADFITAVANVAMLFVASLASPVRILLQLIKYCKDV